MTNREKLCRAARLIGEVQADNVISPTPYSHLQAALHGIEEASRFVLDEKERDGLRVATPA